jgi:hypothetical protein
MEQRRLRLGDILDDYCPRERRVTNHAVVAMIEEDVKQTRCTTCDAEHVYKGGKAPRRKKAQSTGALYKEVLAGMEEPAAGATPRTAAPLRDPEHSVEPDDMSDPESTPESLAAPVSEDTEVSNVNELNELDLSDDDDSQARLLPPDEGSVHRPLIRAQLPRPEGFKIERPAPDFTIRQNNARGGFRGRGPGGNGNATGGGGGHRFGRGPNRGGQGRGPNQGFGRGGGNGQQRQDGRKRGR